MGLDQKVRKCPYCKSASCKPRYVAEGFRVVECLACGFVYVQNPSPDENFPQSYNTYFENAAVLEEGRQNENEVIQNSWNIYQQRLGLVKSLVPQGRLLEIGCGRGYFLHLAQKNGYDVTGIEISPVASLYAKNKYQIDVLTGDIEKEKPLDTGFDVIVLWHVLEHFNDPAAVLNKVYNMLKKDGTLIIEVPNLNSIKFLLAGESNRWIGGNHPRFHLSFFTITTLRKFLKKTGFAGIKVLHINYSGKQRFSLAGIKRALNIFHVDSFLTIKAVKEPAE